MYIFICKTICIYRERKRCIDTLHTYLCVQLHSYIFIFITIRIYIERMKYIDTLHTYVNLCRYIHIICIDHIYNVRTYIFTSTKETVSFIVARHDASRSDTTYLHPSRARAFMACLFSFSRERLIYIHTYIYRYI